MTTKVTINELQETCLLYKQYIYDILKSKFKDYTIVKIAFQPILKLYLTDNSNKSISFYIHFNILEDNIEYLFITEINDSIFYIPLPSIKDKLLISTNIKAYLSGLLWDFLEPKE